MEESGQGGWKGQGEECGLLVGLLSASAFIISGEDRLPHQNKWSKQRAFVVHPLWKIIEHVLGHAPFNKESFSCGCGQSGFWHLAFNHITRNPGECVTVLVCLFVLIHFGLSLSHFQVGAETSRAVIYGCVDTRSEAAVSLIADKMCVNVNDFACFPPVKSFHSKRPCLRCVCLCELQTPEQITGAHFFLAFTFSTPKSIPDHVRVIFLKIL